MASRRSKDRVSLGDLTPDPGNTRVHTPRNVAAIEASLQKVGAGRSIVAARDPSGKLVILAGNATAEAAGNVGLETARIVESDGTEIVVVVRTDLVAGSDDATYLGVSDNRTAEFATWDVPRLQSLPQEVIDAFFTPIEMGRLVQTLDKKLSDVKETDDPPEDPEHPDVVPFPMSRTQPGDVWTLGPHLLVCGSSDSDAIRTYWTTLWASIGDVPSLIATDPPYGIDYETIRKGRRNQKQDDWGAIDGDDTPPDDVDALETLLFRAVQGIDARTAVVWHPQMGLRLAFWKAMERDFWAKRQEIVWVKDAFVFSRADYHWQHETATVFAKPGHYSSANRTLSTVWHAPSPSKPVHPTQKPLALYATPILHHTSQGEIVYDPFAGSGTCVIACQETGRIAHVVEKSPEYCDRIIERWQIHSGETAQKVGSVAAAEDKGTDPATSP